MTEHPDSKSPLAVSLIRDITRGRMHVELAAAIHCANAFARKKAAVWIGLIEIKKEGRTGWFGVEPHWKTKHSRDILARNTRELYRSIAGPRMTATHKSVQWLKRACTYTPTDNRSIEMARRVFAANKQVHRDAFWRARFIHFCILNQICLTEREIGWRIACEGMIGRDHRMIASFVVIRQGDG